VLALDGARTIMRAFCTPMPSASCTPVVAYGDQSMLSRARLKRTSACVHTSGRGARSSTWVGRSCGGCAAPSPRALPALTARSFETELLRSALSATMKSSAWGQPSRLVTLRQASVTSMKLIFLWLMAHVSIARFTVSRMSSQSRKIEPKPLASGKSGSKREQKSRCRANEMPLARPASLYWPMVQVPACWSLREHPS
jgi:hypothetical protein